ncbi:AAA family ATPase [Leifsonia sp. NPDC058194]|uniref:AAA family ATPase n=1 Tax=Leifsonia sp. NPDC058194 TaxID=3346374 RepID=UPI0036D969DA
MLFDPKEGFSLLRLENLAVGNETVYGERERKVEKIFSSYARSGRSLGVMLSGDKGQGKSLFLRMVATKALELEIPVILVTEDAEGIADFLDTLDECIIVFDEFEKVFPAGRRGRDENDRSNRQNQFLTLFDGMSSTRRIYCVTVNDVDDVSAYIVNRPGRFHYHMRFDYPGPDEVRKYLSDQAPSAAAEEVENAALFSRRVNLNYDHLRAIAFELNDSNAKFAEIIEDMNIKAVEPSHYRVEATFDNGVVLSDEVALNLFERADDHRIIELRNANRAFYFSFIPKDLRYSDDGEIRIPVDKLMPCDEDEEYFDEMPLSVTLTLVGQASYAYETY